MGMTMRFFNDAKYIFRNHNTKNKPLQSKQALNVIQHSDFVVGKIQMGHLTTKKMWNEKNNHKKREKNK